MSVRVLLQAGVIAAIDGLEVSGVFDAPPVRAALPYALVEEVVLADWSTKDMAGREGRFAVQLHDGGERPARLRVLAGAVEDAIEVMDRELGEGWRIVSLTFVRGRIVRERDAHWTSLSQFRVRMLKES
ncbi:DUF3168 domain-containing protein [Sphingomonas sp. AOB5]|uniref:DUF3168 domain-containing protein n=1 Tax=Sphingomonas sp. AOB5 TaxID=3034017 RepID=UPI0023F80799|nr:DUF3168 domain-containing protein [Sphingomonas sp. AOB5]MDF7777802.1 DUF3168 domain-containing protein [Sphingomonas sp. AOB5]